MLFFCLTGFWFLCSESLVAQPASLDLSFNPALNSGADIYAITLQTNGQVLIGGFFSSIEDQPRFNIARLNRDGSLDRTFDADVAADQGYVNAIAIQNDGKILIGGLFFSSRQLNPNYLARLNADGSVDEDFGPGLIIDAPVNAIVVQNDGRIVFGGGFEQVNRMVRRSVARLFSDGTLDFEFDACVASTEGDGATALALQSDGKILATGNFTFSTGTTRNGIARLGLCGDLDPTYAPPPGINQSTTASTFILKKDGKVIIGGNFETYHDVSRQGIARLTTAGLVDESFDPGIGIDIGTSVYTMALQPDGKLVIGGDFPSYDGHSVASVGRVSANGQLELAFDPGSGPDNVIGTVAVQDDGKILVGGRFGTFAGVPRPGLVRLNGDWPRSRLGAPGINNGRVQFTVYGEIGTNYTVQSSSNLIDWCAFTNFTASDAATLVSDPKTPLPPKQFYRAIGH